MIDLKSIFKKFQKERIAEDKKRSKGKNFDYMQEVYSTTELFDISLLKDRDKFTEKEVNSLEVQNNIVVYFGSLKSIALPFESIFIKRNEGQFVFLHEYNPNIITGSAWHTGLHKTYNVSFQINTEDGSIQVGYILDHSNESVISYNAKEKEISLLVEIVKMAVRTINILCSLPKHSVISDTPKNEVAYYRRKKGNTIKVINRPIYYVMSKDKGENLNNISSIKACGSLSYSYAFKVRGHWRTINSSTYGKDRRGQYTVLGHTWVKDYTKNGDKELISKIRVLK